MSGFSQFLGAVAGQVATRLILNKVGTQGLGQREPKPYVLPVIIPGGVDVDGQPPEGPVRSGRFTIPNWLFFTGYGALRWYAAKATTPVIDLPDLGDPEPEGDMLFPTLKRELTHLDVQDVATSDDPVEACLERAGWKLDRVDALRQGIFDKEQVDIWKTPEPLTRSEGELLQAIETCMQGLEAQYGSLEAAGVGCSVCDGDDPDLGAVQREMFDPEQIEMALPIAYKTTEQISLLYEYLDSLEPGEPANILDACIWILGSENCGAAQTDNTAGGMETVIHLVKMEGYYYLDDLRKAYKLGDKASIPQHRKTQPEQTETVPRDHIEFLLNQYLERLESGEEPTIEGAALHVYGRKEKQYKEALLGILRAWGFKNWSNFKATMKIQGRWTSRKTKSTLEATPLGPFTFDGLRCRDAQGAFVPVSQCKGPVGRDKAGRFVSIK